MTVQCLLCTSSFVDDVVYMPEWREDGVTTCGNVCSSAAAVWRDILTRRVGLVAGCVLGGVLGWDPLAGAPGTKCAVPGCLKPNTLRYLVPTTFEPAPNRLA